MILTEEHQMIRDALRSYAQERLAPNAARWDKEHYFPKEELKELAGLGAFGVAVPVGGAEPLAAHLAGEAADGGVAVVLQQHDGDGQPLLDGGDQGRVVVVGQDHRRSLPRHVGSLDSHRNADVGLFDGGRVVDAGSSIPFLWRRKRWRRWWCAPWAVEGSWWYHEVPKIHVQNNADDGKYSKTTNSMVTTVWEC